MLQTAAFASQRFIKRGRPFVVGQTGSKQNRTCKVSASINFAPPQSTRSLALSIDDLFSPE
ncbi:MULTISPECIES: hypothetical protein [unclassified Mesorhizobium]|uniref:hypothetical protein n=1 Tax=unclassified Mesorhizobium TaxID=325217 RepID=UPI000F75B08A|nr:MULTISPECIES: hypothetical protein [unclassified Mesorhizobium]AZO53225.1 hypothetical protein EJ077_06685 [Mesorhizobium sp. M8A.F.Ca.ET.057.01.1.1]RWE44885.1 MAG: hypothetical protein EOS80_19245 [Mesorhizobium sp.]